MKKILFVSIVTVIFSVFPLCNVDAQKVGVMQLNDDNFKESIKSGYVLVDFWAPWCAPCRKLAPILDELATEFVGKVKFAKLNVDEETIIAKDYAVQSLPTLILFKDGKAKKAWMGLRTKENLTELINTEI
ncbi:MAG: thioredoxin [Bacteroidales bacterium]